MQPWMIIAGLIGLGMVVLLIAPSIHRRINANSRAAAAQRRDDRAAALRSSATGESRAVANYGSAVKLRDLLLLRGVRVEILQDDGETSIVFERADRGAVDAASEELEIG